jgi:hypothetical protein
MPILYPVFCIGYLCDFLKLTSDQTALIALRCLGLLFIGTKTKRADGDIPFLMNFVPVGNIYYAYYLKFH